MKNPYIKHGTLLVEFDDYVKIHIRKLISLNYEHFSFKKMIKKKTIPLMSKDDVMFKGVVA